MLIFDHDEFCELENETPCEHHFCFCLTRFYIENSEHHELGHMDVYMQLGGQYGPINFWDMYEKHLDDHMKKRLESEMN